MIKNDVNVSISKVMAGQMLAFVFMMAAPGCGPQDADPVPFTNGGSGGAGGSGLGFGGNASAGSGGGTSLGTGGSGLSFGAQGGNAPATMQGGASGAMGGSVGTGGAAVASGNTITDLETGAHHFDDKQMGVVGAWFSYGDATVGASLTPAAGTVFKPATPGYNSMYAACLKGSGFTTWGAGLGFNLNDPGNGMGGSAVKSFDAASYTGIAFWAKASTALSIKFKVPTKSSDPAGSVCMGATGATSCYNHPAKEVVLSTEWQPYTVPFASLMQEAGWGLQAVFNPSELFGVRIEVGSAAGSFDFCVDNVGFVK
jgi:hypothetical protein